MRDAAAAAAAPLSLSNPTRFFSLCAHGRGQMQTHIFRRCANVKHPCVRSAPSLSQSRQPTTATTTNQPTTLTAMMASDAPAIAHGALHQTTPTHTHTHKSCRRPYALPHLGVDGRRRTARKVDSHRSSINYQLPTTPMNANHSHIREQSSHTLQFSHITRSFN